MFPCHDVDDVDDDVLCRNINNKTTKNMCFSFMLNSMLFVVVMIMYKKNIVNYETNYC